MFHDEPPYSSQMSTNMWSVLHRSPDLVPVAGTNRCTHVLTGSSCSHDFSHGVSNSGSFSIALRFAHCPPYDFPVGRPLAFPHRVANHDNAVPEPLASAKFDPD
jgi:hypothetical protein